MIAVIVITVLAVLAAAILIRFVVIRKRRRNNQKKKFFGITTENENTKGRAVEDDRMSLAHTIVDPHGAHQLPTNDKGGEDLKGMAKLEFGDNPVYQLDNHGVSGG